MSRYQYPARLLALVLALILAFSLAAIPALAEEPDPADGENTRGASSTGVVVQAGEGEKETASPESVGSAESTVQGTGVTASASGSGSAASRFRTSTPLSSRIPRTTMTTQPMPIVASAAGT